MIHTGLVSGKMNGPAVKTGGRARQGANGLEVCKGEETIHNNAGYGPPHLPFGDLLPITWQQITVRVNGMYLFPGISYPVSRFMQKKEGHKA
jgi:hypothetical protein